MKHETPGSSAVGSPSSRFGSRFPCVHTVRTDFPELYRYKLKKKNPNLPGESATNLLYRAPVARVMISVGVFSRSQVFNLANLYPFTHYTNTAPGKQQLCGGIARHLRMLDGVPGLERIQNKIYREYRVRNMIG